MGRGRRYRTRRGKSEDQYFGLFYAMARSLAFRSLSGAALKVFLEVRTRFNGGNNGELSLSLDEAARLLGIGKGTAQRAFAELQEKGFLRMLTGWSDLAPGHYRHAGWHGFCNSICHYQTLHHSGIPAFRRPSAHLARAFGGRTGNTSIRSEIRSRGCTCRICAAALSASASWPASAALAASTLLARM
jgi:hypothetical protein